MEKKKWIYYNPTFESEQYNPMMLVYSPWTGHKRFAYDYVRFMVPSTIVELGSYYGCSAFSFLQAVKDGALNTEFYAVDTWAGDDYTQNDYKEDIYSAYKNINDRCFLNTNSHMLRMTFDEALKNFKDKSIDLLHIDGSHSYEDVKHDWNTWKDKVKENGVVFFHDVGADLLFGEKMGSHIFWEELKLQMPYTLEFGFSNGLGVLFKDKETYELLKENADLSVYQTYINLQDTINKDELRKDFFKQRDLEKYNADLLAQIAGLKKHLDKYKEDSALKQQYINSLEESVSKQTGSDLEKLKIFAGEKDAYAKQLEEEKSKLEAFAGEKDSYAKQLEEELRKLNTFANEKEKYSVELKKQLEELNQFAASKEAYVKVLENQLLELREFSKSKEAYAKELLEQMEELNAFASAKDLYAKELEKKQNELNCLFTEREKDFKILQDYAGKMEHSLNAEIAKLLDEIEKYKQYTNHLDSCRKDAEKKAEQLVEKIKKLPFGARLLKGIE